MTKNFVNASLLALLAGACLSTVAFAFGDDHGKTESTHAATDDHAVPAPHADDAPAPAEKKPKRRSKKADKAQAEAHGDAQSDAHTPKAETHHDAHAKSDHAPAAIDTPASPADVLTWLSEGNARWVSGNVQNPSIESERREDLASNGQKPLVTIVSCADSRIPLERVFDRGVGEIFAVRVAGNVAGDSEVGTVEYGLGHLNTKLLVVLGHSKCGAVNAAATNAPVHGMIARLVSNIQPAVDRAKRNHPGANPDELMTYAVKENVWQTIFDLLRESSEVRELVASGKVTVVGAVYDIASGKVEWLGEHPWQRELIAAITPARTEQALDPAHASAQGVTHAQQPAQRSSDHNNDHETEASADSHADHH